MDKITIRYILIIFLVVFIVLIVLGIATMKNITSSKLETFNNYSGNLVKIYEDDKEE